MSFPVPDRDTNIPSHLLLCIKCRESRHSLDNCPRLTRDETLELPVQVLRKAYRAQWQQGLVLPHTRLPKKIQLRPASSEMWLQPCRGCRTLPILELLSSKELGTGLAHSTIGWVSDLQFRQDCPICVALVNSVPDNIKTKHGYAVLVSRPSLLRYLPPPVPSMPERPARSLCMLVNDDVEIPLDEWLSEGIGRLDDSSEAIQAMTSSDDNREEHSAFQACPFREEILNYPMIHEWLRRCDMFHPGTCNSFKSSNLDAMHLIDVTCRKLTSYVDAGRPDYLVLSYVWGDIPTPTYPATSTIGNLPRTLEDAMKLTQISSNVIFGSTQFVLIKKAKRTRKHTLG